MIVTMGTSVWIFLFIFITRRALQHLLLFIFSGIHVNISDDNTLESGTSGSNNTCTDANALHLQSK